MAAVIWAVEGWYLPSQLQAALLIVLMVVLTGGIHLDGFMDTIDGLFSGREREKCLEIMRDSRVGAFGVIGAICLLLFKFSLLANIPTLLLIKLLVVQADYKPLEYDYVHICFSLCQKGRVMASSTKNTVV